MERGGRCRERGHECMARPSVAEDSEAGARFAGRWLVARARAERERGCWGKRQSSMAGGRRGRGAVFETQRARVGKGVGLEIARRVHERGRPIVCAALQIAARLLSGACLPDPGAILQRAAAP